LTVTDLRKYTASETVICGPDDLGRLRAEETILFGRIHDGIPRFCADVAEGMKVAGWSDEVKSVTVTDGRQLLAILHPGANSFYIRFTPSMGNPKVNRKPAPGPASPPASAEIIDFSAITASLCRGGAR
jgi:hypothetical protein